MEMHFKLLAVTQREIAYVVMLLAPIAAFAGVFTAIIRRKQLRNEQQLLALYLLVALLTDLLSRLLGTMYGNNLILVPLFGLAELLLFTVFYYRYVLSKKHPFVVWLVAGCFLLICLDLFLSNWDQPTQFHAYGRVLSGLVIVLLSVLSLGYLLRNPQAYARNWLRLSAGILAYYAVDSLWFIAVNFLVNQHLNLVFSLWMVHALATPLFYVFLTYHLWQTGKTR